MEELDFTGAGALASLNLSATDIQNMTDADNALTININSTGDSITLSDPTANINTDTSTPGEVVYTIYDDSDHGTANELAQLTVITAA
jgi:hypothetical protein